MRKYTYQMTEKEGRELCFRVIWEYLFIHRVGLLVLSVILAMYIILPVIVMPKMGLMMGLMTGSLLLAVFAVFITLNYYLIKRQLCKKTQTMRIEDGMLKVSREGELQGNTPCDGITEIRMTRHLLLLGYHQTPKTIRWYAIPLRVFGDEQERDRFVKAIRDPQAQTWEESSGAVMGEHEAAYANNLEEQEIVKSEAVFSGESGQEYLSVSFLVGEEEWIKTMAEATEIIQSGTLGEQKKGLYIVMAFAAAFVLYSGWMAWRVPMKEINAYIAPFIGTVVLLALLSNLWENPEKRIRAQIRRGIIRNNLWGDWQASITEQGVCQGMPGKISTMVLWENLHCMVETDARMFFYQKDKRHFIVLPKAGMESREQAESLKALCREKHVNVLKAKRKKYAPNWLFPVLITILILGFIMISIWWAFRDF